MPRPLQRFHGFVGQTGAVQLLKDQAAAILATPRLPLVPLLLVGQPGMGQSRLATAAQEALATTLVRREAHTLRPDGIEALVEEAGDAGVLWIRHVDALGEATANELADVIRRTVAAPSTPGEGGPEELGKVALLPAVLWVLEAARLADVSAELASRCQLVELESYGEREMIDIGRTIARESGIEITAQGLRRLAQRHEAPRMLELDIHSIVARFPDAQRLEQAMVAGYLKTTYGEDENVLNPIERRALVELASGEEATPRLALVQYLGIDAADWSKRFEPRLVRRFLIVHAQGGLKATRAGVALAKRYKAQVASAKGPS